MSFLAFLGLIWSEDNTYHFLWLISSLLLLTFTCSLCSLKKVLLRLCQQCFTCTLLTFWIFKPFKPHMLCCGAVSCSSIRWPAHRTGVGLHLSRVWAQFDELLGSKVNLRCEPNRYHGNQVTMHQRTTRVHIFRKSKMFKFFGFVSGCIKTTLTLLGSLANCWMFRFCRDERNH